MNFKFQLEYSGNLKFGKMETEDIENDDYVSEEDEDFVASEDASDAEQEDDSEDEKGRKSKKKKTAASMCHKSSCVGKTWYQ